MANLSIRGWEETAGDDERNPSLLIPGNRMRRQSANACPSLGRR
jgi:hypothetical protein